MTDDLLSALVAIIFGCSLGYSLSVIGLTVCRNAGKISDALNRRPIRKDR